MDFDLIIGLIVIIIAFGFTTFLTIISARNIKIISNKKLHNLRAIQKELRHGR
jgi:hypothetical protein